MLFWGLEVGNGFDFHPSLYYKISWVVSLSACCSELPKELSHLSICTAFFSLSHYCSHIIWKKFTKANIQFGYSSMLELLHVMNCVHQIFGRLLISSTILIWMTMLICKFNLWLCISSIVNKWHEIQHDWWLCNITLSGQLLVKSHLTFIAESSEICVVMCKI